MMWMAAAGLGIAGCQTAPVVTNAAAWSPVQQRIQEAEGRWPVVAAAGPALKRPFFATIHIAGHRTTASGLLQYHNARDFRITAVTEMGVILFDGRMNWAGVTVLRSMPGVDKGVIETLLRDLATAFALPTSLAGGEERGGTYVVHETGADTNKYTWMFDAASGRLRETEVSLGLFDTLHVNYLRYNGAGWPAEIAVTRKARLYTISLSFTDDAVAQHDALGSRP
jgi:hypothetical protein